MENVVATRKYVANYSTYQMFKYLNVCPAGKLISINVIYYTLASVGLDLIGLYVSFKHEMYRYAFVIVHYFRKCI